MDQPTKPYVTSDNSFREFFGDLLADVLIGTIEDAINK